MTTAAKPVALVTGASSGIGRAAAAALVVAGFEVIGTGRKTSGIAPLDSVRFLDLDITSDESVSTAVGRVIEQFGRLDVLVNNAGTGAAGAAEESSVAQDQRVFDINFFGLVRPAARVRIRGPRLRGHRSADLRQGWPGPPALSDVTAVRPPPIDVVMTARRSRPG